MDWITALHLYVAIWVVMVLHELGHLPTSLQLKWWGPFPILSAMKAQFRLGGPLVSLLLAIFVARSQTTNPWVAMIGLVAFLHLLLYAIFGSLLPEPRPGQINVKTYVFDDFDNRYAGWFLTGVFVLFFWLWPYYGPFLKGVWAA